MFEFLIDNIFAMLDGRVFQHTVGILMGSNFAPLRVDFFIIPMRQTSYNGFSRKTRKKTNPIM